MKVFPNPSATEFTLLVSGNNTAPIAIRVVDVLGRPVHQARVLVNQSYKFGQGFVPGVYIVQILQSGLVKTIKVVKN